MPNWTNAQLKAIETTDKTLLISAAAGSGKTTVLIERIIRSLTREKDPADISKMLIVTFTRAAAAELRQRISAALSKAIAERPGDKRLFKQLTLLGSAHISTIDSFYSYVVRRNSDKLNISPSLRTVDKEELIPIRKAIMDKVIEQGYLGKLGHSADDFADMTEILCDMRNDSSLADVFIGIYDKLLYHPHFIEFLSESASFYDAASECDFFDSPIGTVLKEYIVSQIEYCEAILSVICEFFSSGEFADGKYLPPYRSDLDFCAIAKDTALNKGYVATREMINSYSAQKLVSMKSEDHTPEIDYFIGLRDIVKAKITTLKKNYFSYSFSDDEIKNIGAASADRIRILHDLLSEFERLYSEEKASRGVCEFNDVKLWTYKLLVSPDGSPTELAIELSHNFDTVYIDEYQDVDLIQDMIFKAIAKPRSRFMVGDIKQSIYGFRGAEPSLFMNYRNSFPLIDDAPEADECTVFMSDNFRCDEPIIKFTNLVCSYIFKTGGKEITYTDSDDLGLAKEKTEGYTEKPVKIALIDTKKYDDDEDEASSSYGAEEEYIANEIIKLTKNEVKSNGKAITYSDIAVLYRSASFGRKVAKALDAKGIPHTFGSSENIFDCPEVSLTLSLLRVIDNPRRDIPLAGVLMSPIFGLTAQNIAEINELAIESERTTLFDKIDYIAENNSYPLSEKCQSIIREISELRTASESLPTDRIIRQLYSAYSILSRGDEASSSALTTFYESARSYEGDTFKGLYGYLRYLDDMLNAGKTISYTAQCDANSVNFSTIHLSKGLEFPVCFVCGTSIPFNRDDAKELLLYSQSLGIAMDLGDKSGFGRFRTPFRSALSREIYDSSSEEEMRVLYVAFTRARERLYVTAKCRYGAELELSKARWRKAAGTRSSILDSNNYISWILTAIYGVNSEFFDVERVYAADISAEFENAVQSKHEEDQTEKKYSDEELKAAKNHIEDIFSYKYPYNHISNLPAKLSVSKLSPVVLDRNDDLAEDTSDDSLDQSLPQIINTPIFMNDSDTISAAQKGTDTHTFLQFCDFERVTAFGVQNELERLIRDGFIEKRAEKSVNLKQIENFFGGELFKRIQKARAIYREQRFNILLPAARFTEDEQYARELGDETLLVQGVIDLVFESEDGRLILCDYKTDHLSPAELRNRSLAAKKLTDAHRRQLSYYSAAVKRLFGKAPDEVLIYSLPLGDTVSVIPENIDIPTEYSPERKNKK